jgi:predicted transcriptional regulator
MSASPRLKQRVLDVVEALPADATIEDAIERLVFLAKVERGLAQVEAGQLIPHDEIVKRFSQ